MQIYLIEAENTGIYKIGVSKDSKKRLKQLQTGCPFKIVLKESFNSQYAFKIESNIHRTFQRYKTDDISGEWFALDDEAISDFNNLCEIAHNSFKALDESGNPFFKK